MQKKSPSSLTYFAPTTPRPRSTRWASAVLSVLTSFVAVHAIGQQPRANASYPALPAAKVVISAEDYQPRYRSLQNLRALYVDVAPIQGFYKRLRQGNADELVGQLRSRVEAAGLRWLDKESIETEPGQPTLNFYPSYKPGCCTLGLWAGFSQGAKVLSAPGENYRLSSWGDGANHYGGEKGASCLDPVEWVQEHVLEKLNDFLADYERAQEQQTHPAKTPIAPAKNCSTAPILFVEMFDTDSKALGLDQRRLLDALANRIGACNSLRYRIEAHSDQRGTATYNLQLSKARADVVQAYLIARGVPGSRLDSHALGESKLVSNDTTAADHAANRRVVITPVRVAETAPEQPPASVFRLIPKATDL